MWGKRVCLQHTIISLRTHVPQEIGIKELGKLVLFKFHGVDIVLGLGSDLAFGKDIGLRR